MHGGKISPMHGSNKGEIDGVKTHLPKSLCKHFERAINDPELLSLTKDVARLEGFIEDRFEKMAAGPLPAELWKSVEFYTKEIRARADSGDEKKAAEIPVLCRKLEEVVANGLGYEKSETEALTLIQEKRKVAETEHKRLQMIGGLITVQEAMALMGQVVKILHMHVNEPRVLKAIATDVTKLVDFESRKPTGARSGRSPAPR